jgi:hypothetical protein
VQDAPPPASPTPVAPAPRSAAAPKARPTKPPEPDDLFSSIRA